MLKLVQGGDATGPQEDQPAERELCHDERCRTARDEICRRTHARRCSGAGRQSGAREHDHRRGGTSARLLPSAPGHASYAGSWPRRGHCVEARSSRTRSHPQQAAREVGEQQRHACRALGAQPTFGLCDEIGNRIAPVHPLQSSASASISRAERRRISAPAVRALPRLEPLQRMARAQAGTRCRSQVCGRDGRLPGCLPNDDRRPGRDDDRPAGLARPASAADDEFLVAEPHTSTVAERRR